MYSIVCMCRMERKLSVKIISWANIYRAFTKLIGSNIYDQALREISCGISSSINWSGNFFPIKLHPLFVFRSRIKCARCGLFDPAIICNQPSVRLASTISPDINSMNIKKLQVGSKQNTCIATASSREIAKYIIVIKSTTIVCAASIAALYLHAKW